MSDKVTVPENTEKPNQPNDELADIKAILDKYGKHAITVLLGVMIIFSAIQFYANHKKNKIAEASAKLNGATSITDLEEVIANYSGTQAAEMAQISLAKQYFDSANYEAALTSYDNFISDYPDNAQVDVAKLGRIFCIEARDNQEAFQEASTEYATFIQENPDSFLTPQAAFGLGRCLEQLNKLEEARLVYEDFITNESDSPWVSLAEGLLEKVVRKLGNEPMDDSMPTEATVETKEIIIPTDEELPENTTGTILDPVPASNQDQ